jgi:uncharacterized membrane protein YfcA
LYLHNYTYWCLFCGVAGFINRAWRRGGYHSFTYTFIGVDIHYAIGASLVSVIATSSGSAAAYVKEGITNIRLGMFLEIATTIGALAGALLAIYIPTNI